MAYWFDKKRNRWIISVHQGRNALTGKYERKYRTAMTKEQAQDIDRELTERRHKKEPIPSSKTTLKQYIDESFIPVYCANNVRERTLQDYESKIRVHILPALGYMRIVEISTEKIDRFLAELLKSGLSKRTVHHVYSILHNILNQARKHKYIISNPADDASAPSPDDAEIQSFDFAEVECFLEAAKGSLYYPLYQTAIHTGMRRSELCGLKWSDVDFNMGVIAVRRVVYRIKGKGLKVDKPKTVKSNRLIPITSTLDEILRAHKNWISLKIDMASKGNRALTDDDFVFLNTKLGPQDPDRVGNDFHEIVEKNNLGSITLHGLRHTFATLAREAGMDIKDISEILGHSTTATTSDIYQHSKVWLQKESMETFAAKLKQGGKSP